MRRTEILASFILLASLLVWFFPSRDDHILNINSTDPKDIPSRRHQPARPAAANLQANKSSNIKIGSEIFSRPELRTAESLRSQFKILFEQRDSYDKSRLTKAAFTALENISGTVSMAVDAVKRPARYLCLFGDDEAVVRTYAIKFLINRDPGDPTTLDALMGELIESLDAEGEAIGGQAYDLEIIAATVLRRTLQGRQPLSPQNARTIAREIVGARSDLSPMSTDALVLAFFYTALASGGREVAQRVAQAVADEFG